MITRQNKSKTKTITSAMVNKNFYFSIHEYIYELVGDWDTSLRLVNVFTRAEIPLQTFITAVKLFTLVKNRATPERNSKTNNSTLQKNNIVKLVKYPYTTFISCCVISSKYYKDIPFDNESWGGLSCINKYEINDFERATLTVLDYKINSAGDKHIMNEVQNFLKKAGIDNTDRRANVFDLKNFIKNLFCISDKI